MNSEIYYCFLIFWKKIQEDGAMIFKNDTAVYYQLTPVEKAK